MEQKTLDPLRQNRNKDSSLRISDTETYSIPTYTNGVVFLQLRNDKVLYNM